MTLCVWACMVFWLFAVAWPGGAVCLRMLALHPPRPQLTSLSHTHASHPRTCRCRCRGPSEALNSWSGNIGRLLVLVEKTCQQIQKESMVHRVPIGAA